MEPRQQVHLMLYQCSAGLSPYGKKGNSSRSNEDVNSFFFGGRNNVVQPQKMLSYDACRSFILVPKLSILFYINEGKVCYQ